MRIDPTEFFSVQQHIIGNCPICKAFFRLSELRLIQKRGRRDWLDEMHDAERKLEAAEDRLAERERELRQVAREKGRAHARRQVRKVDPLFAPRGLCAEDAKPLFNPVDYLVFDGLARTDQVSRIYLLDRKCRGEHRVVQRSIEACVNRGRYEWLTLRISDAGVVEAEE